MPIVNIHFKGILIILDMMKFIQKDSLTPKIFQEENNFCKRAKKILIKRFLH